MSGNNTLRYAAFRFQRFLLWESDHVAGRRSCGIATTATLSLMRILALSFLLGCGRAALCACDSCAYALWTD